MIDKMYSNNIHIILTAENSMGIDYLRIKASNDDIEATRCISKEEASMPEVLYYWCKQSADDIVKYMRYTDE